MFVTIKHGWYDATKFNEEGRLVNIDPDDREWSYGEMIVNTDQLSAISRYLPNRHIGTKLLDSCKLSATVHLVDGSEDGWSIDVLEDLEWWKSVLGSVGVK